MANLKSISINGKSIFDIMYPVGSIYQTMDSSFNPSTAFGGTWSRIKGRVLVGVDENDSTFKSAKLTGGEKAHKLTKDEIARHDHVFLSGSHSISWGASAGGTVFLSGPQMAAGNTSRNELVTKQNVWTKTDFNATAETAHNNLQPYMTCYIWQRTT